MRKLLPWIYPSKDQILRQLKLAIFLPTSFVQLLSTRRYPPLNYPDIASSTVWPVRCRPIALLFDRLSERGNCDAGSVNLRVEYLDHQEIKRNKNHLWNHLEPREYRDTFPAHLSTSPAPK
jgi:hypothetical protein